MMRTKLANVLQLFLTGLILLSAPIDLLSQQTIITGDVRDSETHETIPFVNIYFKGTTIGTTTDPSGHFNLATRQMVDSLTFSAVGYYPKSILIQNSVTNNVSIILIPDNIQLNEVNVVPDDGPMRALFQKIIDHKSINNPEKHNRFEYEKYTKWEYRINNLNDKVVNSFLFKQNKSVIKTDSSNARFLPVYFSEQIVHNEFQRNPLKQKSTILADKTSGLGILKDYEISGYTSGLDIEVNFYDNYINLFVQNFVSPLANNGWFYYKYYLADSVMTESGKTYKIKFNPRRNGDKVFSGYFTVEDTYYSLVDIDATLANTSQINFLKYMRLESSYQHINDSVPFYHKNLIEATIDYLPVDLKPDSKHIEVAYTQLSIIDKVKVNLPDPVELSAKSLSYESIKLNGSYDRDSSFWSKARPIELTQQDKILSGAIDSANQIPAIKLIDHFASMYMTGYYDFGKFEIGPYDYMFNLNEVEGTHLFLGGRTSSEISKNWMVWGGLGYGTRNEEIVGRFGIGYKFNHPKRRVLKLFYSDDIIKIGENEKILYLYENMLSPQENNLVSYLFQRDKFDELYRQKRISFTYENEWITGFTSKLNLSFLQQNSPEFYPFIYQSNPIDAVNILDGSIDFRWSRKEKYIDDSFLRIYYATDFPIVHLTIGGGGYEFDGYRDYYGKIHTSIKQNVYLQQTYLKYAIEAGICFGKLPYSLLEIPRGNETYGFYTYDFNLMNYLEFIHDQYIHAYFEYHFNGFFFNRVPLLKRLGLREVLSAKGMVGNLSQKQYSLINLPASISSENNKPYLEIGAGIENIIRLVRLEAIWRVTHQHSMLAPVFGIRAKVEVKL